MDLHTNEVIWSAITDSIKEIVSQAGEEVDSIQPSNTLIGDLGIASVNLVHLMVTIEDKLDRPLNFYRLMNREGAAPNRDLTVDELFAFTCESLGVRSRDARG